MFRVRINNRNEARQELYTRAERRAVRNYGELAVKLVQRCGLSGVCYVQFIDVRGQPTYRVSNGNAELVSHG